MKFTYKTESELAAMTPEQRDIYSEQKRQHEAGETKNLVKEVVKDLLPETRESRIAKANPGKSEAEIKALVDAEIKAEEDAAKAQADQVKGLIEDVRIIKESATAGAPGNVTTSLIKEIKENKDALKDALKGQGEVTIKAVTARASIATNPNQMLLPGIGQLIRVARSLYDIFRKVDLPVGDHNGKISYIDWDEDTTVKAAAAIAEGAQYPESTAAFKGYDISLKKIGDTLPVNEEFFEDEVTAAAELEGFIENNVESKIDTDLVNADGTGDNIKGLLASIPAYTAVASGIQDANIYDLITIVKAAIVKPAGAKYRPDFVAMNNTTVNMLLLKKDQNDNYQFPPSHPIFQMIVEDNAMPDNQLVVGDRRYGTIYEMGGVTLSKGVIDKQFVKDQLTLKARKRMLFLIKNSDRSGFRKVTDVTAALALLQS